MTRYNKSKIMTLAHKLRKDYHLTLSAALKQAWYNAKVEVKNEAILAARKAAYEAKIAKETAEYNVNYIAGPARYYAGNAYNGD